MLERTGWIDKIWSPRPRGDWIGLGGNLIVPTGGRYRRQDFDQTLAGTIELLGHKSLAI